jgi:hypothetical protein
MTYLEVRELTMRRRPIAAVGRLFSIHRHLRCAAGAAPASAASHTAAATAADISKKTGRLGIDDMPPKIWVNRIQQECTDTH